MGKNLFRKHTREALKYKVLKFFIKKIKNVFVKKMRWLGAVLYYNRSKGKGGPPGKGPQPEERRSAGRVKVAHLNLDKQRCVSNIAVKLQQLDNRQREGVFAMPNERVPKLRDELKRQCVQVGVVRAEAMR